MFAPVNRAKAAMKVFVASLTVLLTPLMMLMMKALIASLMKATLKCVISDKC